MLIIENLKMKEKYREGLLIPSYHPAKVSANPFFSAACILIHALLNDPERAPSWKSDKEMSQSIMRHEKSFLQPQKNGLWWKYFKIILKESSDVISSRLSCRGCRFFRYRTECGIFRFYDTRGREHIAWRLVWARH